MEVLEKALDFTLNTFEGITIQLSDYLGNKNVVIIFKRGTELLIIGLEEPGPF
jgi:peroxiredoxin